LRRRLKWIEGSGLTESYLARATVGNLALRVISLGLVFICHLLLARLLGAHDYGVYAYALAWIKALCVPATLGLERLVIREVATFRAHLDWASWHGLLIWASRTLLVAAVSIALCAVGVSWLIADHTEGLHTLWLAMALLPMLAFLRLKQFVLQGMHRTIVGLIPETLVHPLLLTTLIAAYYISVGGLTSMCGPFVRRSSVGAHPPGGGKRVYTKGAPSCLDEKRGADAACERRQRFQRTDTRTDAWGYGGC
jgi:O-antigen/teichoic acid export membrane protein